MYRFNSSKPAYIHAYTSKTDQHVKTTSKINDVKKFANIEDNNEEGGPSGLRVMTRSAVPSGSCW